MGRQWLMITAIFALFFFSFNLLAVEHNSTQQNEDSLHRARQLIQDGDLVGAMNELRRIVQTLDKKPAKKKRLAEAHYLLAKVFFTAGDQSLVEEHLRKVFSTDPTFSTHEPDLYFREIVENIKKEFPEIAQQQSPDTQETNSSTNIIAKERKKKRKAPVLLILGGIAILTLLILLLSKKKKSTTESGSIRISSNPSEAKIFLDWAISDEAMAMYAKVYPIVATDIAVDAPDGWPSDPMSVLIDNDLDWAASNRKRILKEWTQRYDAKSEPK